MANASADKFKALAIRHGEKAVVGLAATVFVVLVALAVIHPTLELKSEELKASADAAQSNLNKPQARQDILDKLDKEGIVNPGFEKIVENQVANALKPGDYKVKLEWITPEPGAGLIRDQPDVVRPTDLIAFPGRGGILLYRLENGQRVKDNGADPKKAGKKGNRKGAGGGMGMPGLGGGMGMPGAPGGAGDRPEDKKRKELEDEKKKKAMAGNVDPEKEKDKADPAKGAPPAPVAEGPDKEEVRGKRWVVITGVIDNEQMNKNWLLALKNPAIAFPNYRRVDVQRSTLDSEGNWSEWALVDVIKNFDVLDNLPETDTEYVPEARRPKAIVDELPFIKAGYWTGVHVAKLVPPEIRDPAKGADDMMGGLRLGGGPGAGAMPGAGGGANKLSGGGGGMPGGGGGIIGGGGAPGDAGGTPEEVVPPNFEPSVMLRSLDFTIEANKTYKYRVRLVVYNPNYGHTDVNPGVDVDSKELLSLWSDPTDPVVVPADVAAFAQAPEPNPRRDDLVSFQVVRWDPQTGQTVLKTDEAGPGELVGQFGSVQMPSSDGSGVKSTNIDFNSRSIVLDTMGGRELIPDIGVERNRFTVPAMALLVEPDGSVVVRSQARDRADDVRQDMEENYQQALKDSGKKREVGGGSKMPGGGGKGKKKKGKRR